MTKITTLVLGASLNPDRYSNMAIKLLLKKGFNVKAVGNRKGNVLNTEIATETKVFDDIDTVTLYLSPTNQPKYYEYILQLKPNRIIFNPGTENDELRLMAENKGISTENACTLVLLNLNQY